MAINFNKPYSTGKEVGFIKQAIASGHLSGNGIFTEKCHNLFESKYGLKNSLLTTSCTDALEMASLLLEIKPGDEIIVPSFAFVSTALAFYREGAKIVFADSRQDHPGIDEDRIETLITHKTKAIVVVHYAGVSCDMNKIMTLALKNNLIVIEDAAHAIDATYLNQPLGTIGNFGCFSFHESKNIHCGEGGMLSVNDDKYFARAKNIREKGTNRTSFDTGKVSYYEWVDTGSSFALSDINAAFLLSQIEEIGYSQKSRLKIWDCYYRGLKKLEEQGLLRLPVIPSYASNNGNMFYLICRTESERQKLISYLLKKQVYALFHYRCLHSSRIMNVAGNNGETIFDNAILYQDRLVRLPFYTNMPEESCQLIIEYVCNFFNIVKE